MTHPIHLDEQQRAFRELQQGMTALQDRFKDASTITIKGKDGKTPQRGVDYLTEEEMAQLKMELGNLVIDYVLPRIRQPLDGKTPIPGIDYPTHQQLLKFAETAIENIKKQKLNRKQITQDVSEWIKDKKGFIDWKNVGSTPNVEKLVSEAVEEKTTEIRKEVIKKEAIDWRNIKNKPDFQNLLMASGGGPRIRIREEGVMVSEFVSSLDFIGAGVTAAYGGNGQVTVTISGSSVSVETPTGTVDGANKTFTVTATPKWIVVDGVTYFDGSGYSIAGLTITTIVAPTGFIRAIS